MKWMLISSRNSSRNWTRYAMRCIRRPLFCLLVSVGLSASFSLASETNSVDRGLAYTNAVQQLALKLASGDPVRAVDYQQQIYSLLSNFFSYYENDGVWYTLPMDETTGIPLSDFIGNALFSQFHENPNSGDSYVRAISRALNGTPQGTYANASGGILPLVSGIATNTWRRADIERALLLLAASSNTWDRSSVEDVVDYITSINSGVGMMQLDVYDVKSNVYDLLQSLWAVQTDLESTIDSDGRQRVSLDDLVFDPIVEVIEEQTSTYIQSLDSLVRDFVIGGVDYTASNTADIVEYVANINDILSENIDVQFSAFLDSTSNIIDLVRTIHTDDFGYVGTQRSIASDFASLQDNITEQSSDTYRAQQMDSTTAQTEREGKLALDEQIRDTSDMMDPTGGLSHAVWRPLDPYSAIGDKITEFQQDIDSKMPQFNESGDPVIEIFKADTGLPIDAAGVIRVNLNEEMGPWVNTCGNVMSWLWRIINACLTICLLVQLFHEIGSAI